eukprot:TRINITY_DN21617_c0_g1_i1.p1 TRINITY_DN21617_c0_g1~~TRINITY_DN21617_c0_g1_i1.p1  ORF type:complete len:178 (-),score=24.31 TRINITY_DN21617_c0_g1_i1:248-781(-)
MFLCLFIFFFFKQKTAYEMLRSLVGSEMCIRDRVYTAVDTALIVLSSLSYAFTGWVWMRHGFPGLGWWFVLVAVTSAMADGIVRTATARCVDRCVAIVVVVASVVYNSTSGANLVLSLSGLASALYWLNQSRRVAKNGTARANVRLYLWYHCVWHSYGALVNAAITWWVQSQHLSVS